MTFANLYTTGALSYEGNSGGLRCYKKDEKLE